MIGVDFAAPGTLADISYENDSGRASRRRVKVIRWTHAANGFTYLRAWCFLRGEERTFRADRIMEWHPVSEAGGGPPRASNASRQAAHAGYRRPDAAAYAGVPPAAPQVNLSPNQPARRRAVKVTASEGGTRILSGIIVGIVFIIIKMAWNRPEPTPDYRFISAPGPYVAQAVPVAPSKQAPKPLSKTTPARTEPAASATAPKIQVPEPPRRSVTSLEYRDMTVLRETIGTSTSYSIPFLGTRTDSLPQAKALIRAALFRGKTGITGSVVMDRYEAADTDGNGALDWGELRVFQRRLKNDYRYLNNETALRPDLFLAAGGGDCDDWALFTCGLLRFWDWEAYLGCFAPTSRDSGHAICLIKEESPPPGCLYYTITGESLPGGTGAPPGRYVPVDYEVVGGISNAMGADWELTAVYVPERAYGLGM